MDMKSSLNKMLGGKLDKEVYNFLKRNPNPSDEKVHIWAGKKGFNIHRVEAAMYRLATKQVRK